MEGRQDDVDGMDWRRAPLICYVSVRNLRIGSIFHRIGRYHLYHQ
ncbi:hypothetical protein NPIL_353121, partial [Nephila pilipes]